MRQPKTVQPRKEAGIVLYADPFVDIVLRQSFSEGYPLDEFFVTGITREDLQALADYLLSAPREIYGPLKTLSQKLERFLLTEARY